MSKPETDPHLKVEIVALKVKVDGIYKRLDKMEETQRELVELASFGKGSLKTLTMIGVIFGSLAGITIAIKTWIT